RGDGGGKARHECVKDFHLQPPRPGQSWQVDGQKLREGPELAARLFQPFSAGDVRTGSGLGLAICHEIVQALQGSITLTNRMEGARVTGLDAVVRLPLAPAALPVS
ncbi:MAG: hypothetical protein E6Q94_06520, partial [Burkholderiaceae bacterium]